MFLVFDRLASQAEVLIACRDIIIFTDAGRGLAQTGAQACDLAFASAVRVATAVRPPL